MPWEAHFATTIIIKSLTDPLLQLQFQIICPKHFCLTATILLPMEITRWQETHHGSLVIHTAVSLPFHRQAWSHYIHMSEACYVGLEWSLVMVQRACNDIIRTYFRIWCAICCKLTWRKTLKRKAMCLTPSNTLLHWLSIPTLTIHTTQPLISCNICTIWTLAESYVQ